MPRSLAAALDDIASNIAFIERFTDGKTELDYNRDPLVSATEARRAVNLLNMIYKKAGVGPFA